MTVYIDSSGIKDADLFFRTFPERTAQALSLSINDTMRDVVVKEAKREIYAQVNFPSGYLDSRLNITQFSTPTQLVGKVAGRDRATSLARFAPAASGPVGMGKRIPVQYVQVRRDGARRPTNRLFYVRLRSGDSGALGNLGIAIRLKPGETLRGVTDLSVPREIFKGVFLLYAPSVDQVFQQVSLDIKPTVLDALEDEFYRQFERLA